MEIFTIGLLVIVALSILGVGADSRPTIGDDWRRAF
jgi:hypothetical protein